MAGIIPFIIGVIVSLLVSAGVIYEAGQSSVLESQRFCKLYTVLKHTRQMCWKIQEDKDENTQ
jgi:hypothetical protein